MVQHVEIHMAEVMAWPRNESSNMVQSIHRAVELLHLIAKNQPVGLLDLTRLSGLKKPTVARILNSLRVEGLIDQDPVSKTYGIAMGAFQLGSYALKVFDLCNLARPLMEDYARREKKSLMLSTLHLGRVLYIDKVVAEELYQVALSVGDTYSPHCSASGRAMMAFMPEEECRALLGTIQFEPFTEKTILSREVFEAELEQTKKRGFALDLGERKPGLCAVAAPILKSRGGVAGAVSCPRLMAHIDQDGLLQLGRQIADLSASISRRTGWAP